MFNYYNKEEDTLKVRKIILHSVGLVVLSGVLFGSFGTISAGAKGIKTRFGAVTGKIYDAGLYVKFPFIEQVVSMDVQTQKVETAASAASSDLQDVTSTIAVNYSVDPTQVAKIYQSIGTYFKSRVIDPAIQETVKSSTANFTAEELVTKRETVKEQIQVALTKKLDGFGIKVEALSIINFSFSSSFNQAIEAKVTAEQNALAAKNKLAQVQFEAQQAIEEATGKAKALQIEGQALQSNPQVLQIRAIEKWNGVMPQVTGSAMPFINLK